MDIDQAVTRHRVVFEPPDLIISAPQAGMTVAESLAVWKFVAEMTANVERFYWISDISNLDRSPPGARENPDITRVLSKLQALACVNGGFAQRTIMSLAGRASKLLRLRLLDSELGFFDDEASARIWIDSLRRQIKR